MKNILIVLLLLIASVSFAQSDTTIVYLSKMGIVSDADISLGSSTFGTDQTTAIQDILNMAATRPLTVYWDVKVGITGDSVRSNTTIIAGQYGAIIRDNSNRAVLSNYHATPGTIADSNITIIGGIWNGNGYRGGVAKQSGAYASYGVVVGLRMNGVKGLIVKDLTILNTREWATSFFTVKDVLVSNVKIDQGTAYKITQDGLHFGGYCDNIKVYGLKVRSGDDALAFNTMTTTVDGQGNPMTFYAGKFGAETNIDVRDVYLDSTAMGIRIQSGNQWVDNVNIENVSGRAVNYWLVIDNYSGNPTGTTDVGAGNVGKVRIANISVITTSLSPAFGLPSGYGSALVNCNIKKLILSNYTRNFQSTSVYYPAVRIGGTNTVVGKLIIDGFGVDSSFSASNKTPQIVIDSATVKSFSFTHSTTTNTNPIDSSSLISVKGNATVNELILNGISNNGVSRILSDSATINYVSATNIRHISADTSIAPFYVMPADSVFDFGLSSFWGFKITEGIFHSKRGDGFSGLPPYLNPVASSLLTDFPNASLGFSLRKLSSLYSGACIKVRRSSDNTTQDIGFVSNSLDVTSLLSFVGSNDGFIQTWYDQSGNGNNLTQSTNANQPKIVSAGSVIMKNSHPTVNFISSSADYLVLNNSVSGAATFTAYEVGARANSTSFLLGLTPNNNATNAPYTIVCNAVSTIYVSNATTQLFVSDGGSTALNLLTTLNNSSLSLWINGNSQSLTVSGGVVSNTNMSLLGSRPYNGAFTNGYVSELVFYPHNKSGNNTGIWNNINSYYTIY